MGRQGGGVATKMKYFNIQKFSPLAAKLYMYRRALVGILGSLVKNKSTQVKTRVKLVLDLPNRTLTVKYFNL